MDAEKIKYQKLLTFSIVVIMLLILFCFMCKSKIKYYEVKDKTNEQYVQELIKDHELIRIGYVEEINNNLKLVEKLEQNNLVLQSTKERETKLQDQIKKLTEYIKELKTLLIEKEQKIREINSTIERIENNTDADREKAKATVAAAIKYDVDPYLLAALIQSESSYRHDVTHKHSKVKGMAGIHEGFWEVPNKTVKEQIEAGAYVLSVYLEKYNGDKVKALTGYKGVSTLGRRQARFVYNNYKRIKNGNKYSYNI